MLGRLGMSPQDEELYRALVAHGPLTAADAARLCGTGRERTERVLASLRESGLVSARTGLGGNVGELWEPAPPALALGALLAIHQDELRSLAGEITELDGTYRESGGHRGESGAIEILHGRDTIAHRFIQMQQGARSELLCFSKGLPVAVTGQDNPGDGIAMARGVRARLLVSKDALEAMPDNLREGISHGMEIRVADELPTKLLVVDRRMALLPLLADPARLHDRAVIVHASGIVAALAGLFDQAWARSRPLPAEWRGEDDTAVLGLMLGGLTDEAIAQRLGASARTVQRRIKRLMDRAGATTRFQLGWYARDMGWVTAPEPGPATAPGPAAGTGPRPADTAPAP
ncbi:helix-turn-helix domain-containing protein [Streptomyces sp. NPDC079020]|uniref:helix-turn-helix domain-containing protein n=1 Tax=Streptomyces sp. NPDC079020 TaxID=3365722 RepID=UPI0037D8E151